MEVLFCFMGVDGLLLEIIFKASKLTFVCCVSKFNCFVLV